MKNNPDVERKIFTAGCVPMLAEEVEHKAGIFAGIGIAVAFIQVGS